MLDRHNQCSLNVAKSDIRIVRMTVILTQWQSTETNAKSKSRTTRTCSRCSGHETLLRHYTVICFYSHWFIPSEKKELENRSKCLLAFACKVRHERREEVRICQRLKSREWRSSEYLNVKVFLVACLQTSPISFVARGNNGNRRRLQAGNISRKYQVAQQLSFLFAFAFFYRYLHFLCVFCFGFSYRPCHGFRRHLDEKANMWEIMVGMIKNMNCKLRLQSKGLS